MTEGSRCISSREIILSMGLHQPQSFLSGVKSNYPQWNLFDYVHLTNCIFFPTTSPVLYQYFLHLLNKSLAHEPLAWHLLLIEPNQERGYQKAFQKADSQEGILELDHVPARDNNNPIFRAM